MVMIGSHYYCEYTANRGLPNTTVRYLVHATKQGNGWMGKCEHPLCNGEHHIKNDYLLVDAINQYNRGGGYADMTLCDFVIKLGIGQPII